MWYERLRNKLPVVQPKLYWSGCEPPADPVNELGHYGLLIEYLGDDLVKAEQADGVTELQNRQICAGLAKIHARFWNGEGLSPADKAALMTPADSMALMKSFMGGIDVAAEFTETEIRAALGEKYATYVSAAVRQIDQWLFKNNHDQTCLCSWDFRTDNVLWRRSPGGPDDHECVIIDHQLWQIGGAPVYDLATYLGCSCREEQMAERVDTGLRVYHETLVASGVTTYSWEQFNADFNDAIACPALIGSFCGKMVSDVTAGAMAAPEGSQDRKDALTMADNMKALFTMMSSRVKTLIEHRNAWYPTNFQPKYSAEL